MDSVPEWAPADVDLTTASAARIYDYFLGGTHNFDVDRAVAAKLLEAFPSTPLISRTNRAFLHRTVRHLVSQGVRQFIDLGAGIPTVGSVHETAQQADPASRVLYVDHDPVAVAHSELIIGESASVGVLRADLRRPAELLTSPVLSDLIDLSRPVAVLMFAVLHFLSEDDDPDGVIAQLQEAVVPGSYLVVSHTTDEGRPTAGQQVQQVYRSTASPLTFRSRARIRELFGDWPLLEPGLVWAPQWHPDPEVSGPAEADPSVSTLLVGVARKPG
jgi:hypothetical protein